MPIPRGLCVALLFTARLIDVAAAVGHEGAYSDKLILFGAKKANDEKSAILAWSPSLGGLMQIASFDDKLVLNGSVSPDGRLAAATLARVEPGNSPAKKSVVIVESNGRHREIARGVELVSWYPDSAWVLCRGGDKYNWTHIRVGIDSGETLLVPIESHDAAMDISSSGTICVMKGRPDAQWERSLGDFYPRRQLYQVCADGRELAPFTSADEDCIWWQFRPGGDGGLYYRRHYATGRPIETAVVQHGANKRQLVNFTELGVRPSGQPVWRPDGQEIAWIVSREPDEGQVEFEVMFLRIHNGGPRSVTAKALGLSWLGKIDWK